MDPLVSIGRPSEYEKINARTAETISGLSETKLALLGIVKNAQQLPSCQKVATAALMHSCSTLDGSFQDDPAASSPSVDMHVSGASKIYAARLSICELLEAGTSFLPACESFVPIDRTTNKRVMAGHIPDNGFDKPTELYPNYDEVTTEQLDGCVSALRQEPQTWTSYSNSKQNAVFICHALGDELRKDETIRIYETLVKSAAEMGEAFHAAPREVYSMFEEVKANVMQFWLDLYEHDSVRRDEIETTWSDFKRTMSRDAMDVVKDFREEMVQLQKAGSRATQENIDITQHAFNKLQEGISALTSEQRQGAAAQLEIFNYAAAVFETGITQGLGKATQGLEDHQAQLDEQYQAVVKYSANLANMFVNMESLESRLSVVHSVMEDFEQDMKQRFHALQYSANQTDAVLYRARENAEGLRDAFDSFAGLLSIDWTGGLSRLGSFMALTLIYACLTFGLWESWLGLSYIGAASASLATGNGKYSSAFAVMKKAC